MSELVWDQTGDRGFEVGVSKGVLYLDETSAVVWNGLISIDETKASQEEGPSFFDGQKVVGISESQDYSAKLKAITYPDEFTIFDGFEELENGLVLDSQSTRSFHLTYQTRIGNDLEGIDLGYKIHILYDLTATPSTTVYQTSGSSIQLTNFEWDLSSAPSSVDGYRPTTHAIIDSRNLDPEILLAIEEILYGTEEDDAYLPSLEELTTLIVEWGLIIIIDHGDGTWTAKGPDEYFEMLDSTTFEITEANAVFLDADTYEISSSVPD